MSQNTDSAFYYVNNDCQYAKATKSYELKIKTFKYKSTTEKAVDYYNLAAAYALSSSGQVHESIKNLEISFKLDASTQSIFLFDPDFYSLINNEEWKKFVLKNRMIDKSHKTHQDSIFYVLYKVSIQDQALYKDINCLEFKSGRKSKRLDNLWNAKDSLNELNLRTIEEFIKNGINVLSSSEVGDRFANRCFLVIQHADTLTINKYLPIIEELYKKGETKGENFALLYDRHMVHRTKGKQYYGTQINSSEGKPYPIIDEKNVDNRRKELGMEPLKIYLARFGINYSPKHK